MHQWMRLCRCVCAQRNQKSRPWSQLAGRDQHWMQPGKWLRPALFCAMCRCVSAGCIQLNASLGMRIQLYAPLATRIQPGDLSQRIAKTSPWKNPKDDLRDGLMEMISMRSYLRSSIQIIPWIISNVIFKKIVYLVITQCCVEYFSKYFFFDRCNLFGVSCKMCDAGDPFNYGPKQGANKVFQQKYTPFIVLESCIAFSSVFKLLQMCF